MLPTHLLYQTQSISIYYFWLFFMDSIFLKLTHIICSTKKLSYYWLHFSLTYFLPTQFACYRLLLLLSVRYHNHFLVIYFTGSIVCVDFELIPFIIDQLISYRLRFLLSYSHLHNWWHSIKNFDVFQIENIVEIWANMQIHKGDPHFCVIIKSDK